MDKESIKQHLKDNPNLIVDILENIGCNKVKIHNGSKPRISCTRPDGDNSGAISIKLNDSLSSSVYTRSSEFENYEYNDFYSLIQYLLDCDFDKAMQFICKTCNINYTSYSKNTLKSNKKSGSFAFLKRFKRNKSKENNIEETNENILSEKYLDRFIRGSCKLFYDDGINDNTQSKFGICYDVLDNRVVIPIRNEDGKLLSFKGRLNNDNWKIYDIPKYFYYYPYIGERHLFGYYENYFYIIDADEIYIGESEKFVLQLDSMGINNALAVCKKRISPIQLTLLLKLGKPVVLMFDNDVTLHEILNECAKFKGLIPVYYCKDENNLLGKKDSPTDKGLNTFLKIRDNKIKYNKGDELKVAI